MPLVLESERTAWEAYSVQNFDSTFSTLDELPAEYIWRYTSIGEMLTRHSPNSTKIPVARLCAAMGHIYAQAEQWIDARDAYLDACQWYRMERQRQQGLCKASEYDDDALTAAILTCQQELSDVEKDLEEIMTHRLVVAAPVASPLFASLVAPPRMPRSLLQAKPW